MSDARRVMLAECTLRDVDAQLAESPKVIIPVGSTEQHGSHAPFGTDWMLSTEVSVPKPRSQRPNAALYWGMTLSSNFLEAA